MINAGSERQAADKSIIGATVFVLEDEPMITLDLSLALEGAGARVRSAVCLRSAETVLAEGNIDVAILDVNLGGGETCAPVAETLKARNIPFVLHSGDLDRNGELISGLGAPIVPKPSNSDTLIKVLATVLH